MNLPPLKPSVPTTGRQPMPTISRFDLFTGAVMLLRLVSVNRKEANYRGFTTGLRARLLFIRGCKL